MQPKSSGWDHLQPQHNYPAGAAIMKESICKIFVESGHIVRRTEPSTVHSSGKDIQSWIRRGRGFPSIINSIWGYLKVVSHFCGSSFSCRLLFQRGWLVLLMSSSCRWPPPSLTPSLSPLPFLIFAWGEVSTCRIGYPTAPAVRQTERGKTKKNSCLWICRSHPLH